ncbi:LysR family transcriptional regulator [Nocardiopsis composta]
MVDPKLKVLQAVARHGTVTAAAEALHYTPRRSPTSSASWPRSSASNCWPPPGAASC